MIPLQVILQLFIGGKTQRSSYRLDRHSNLNSTQLRRMESLTRSVARLFGSLHWQAKLDHVLLKQSNGRGSNMGQCNYTRIGFRSLRTIWVDSRLDPYEEACTALHEFSHAFNSYREGHGRRWRLTYLVSWSLYFDTDGRKFRREAKRTIKQYSRQSFWRRHAEFKDVQRKLATAHIDIRL